MSFYYALTIVKNGDMKFLLDYEKYIDSLKVKFTKFNFSIEVHYEKGLQNGLHCHCLVSTSREIRNDYGLKKEGWHITFKKITNHSGWVDYMTKCSEKEERLLIDERQMQEDFFNPAF